MATAEEAAGAVVGSEPVRHVLGGVWLAGVLMVALPRVGAQTPQAPDVTVSAVATPLVPLDQTHPKELSGLTWAGGDQYYAVADGQPTLHPYSIAIDPSAGQVISVTRGQPVPLRDADGRPWRGSDLEGVAFDPSTGDLYVGDESRSSSLPQAIRRHRLADGRQVGSVQADVVAFRARNFRGGYGLESLALTGSTIWTANEDTLVGDGDAARPGRGGLVRLTRIQPDRPAAQWAYRTEPSAGALPYGAGAMSGVVDLVALPDGRLLVLERATSGSRGPGDIGGFISRLYLVDVTDATDIAAIERLEDVERGVDYQPVTKTLLWSQFFSLFGGPNNFEGLALGPRLADGSRSLLLVSDNDVLPSNLYVLTIAGLP